MKPYIYIYRCLYHYLSTITFTIWIRTIFVMYGFLKYFFILWVKFNVKWFRITNFKSFFKIVYVYDLLKLCIINIFYLIYRNVIFRILWYLFRNFCHIGKSTKKKPITDVGTTYYLVTTFLHFSTSQFHFRLKSNHLVAIYVWRICSDWKRIHI